MLTAARRASDANSAKAKAKAKSEGKDEGSKKAKADRDRAMAAGTMVQEAALLLREAAELMPDDPAAAVWYAAVCAGVPAYSESDSVSVSFPSSSWWAPHMVQDDQPSSS